MLQRLRKGRANCWPLTPALPYGYLCAAFTRTTALHTAARHAAAATTRCGDKAPMIPACTRYLPGRIFWFSVCSVVAGVRFCAHYSHLVLRHILFVSAPYFSFPFLLLAFGGAARHRRRTTSTSPGAGLTLALLPAAPPVLRRTDLPGDHLLFRPFYLPATSIASTVGISICFGLKKAFLNAFPKVPTHSWLRLRRRILTCFMAWRFTSSPVATWQH